MAAYVIVDVTVNDPTRYEEYKRLSTKAVAAFGGKFIVRGGAVTTLEGDWHPGRFVVLEFENADRARAWYASAEYAPALALRHATASSKLILVEGV